MEDEWRKGLNSFWGQEGEKERSNKDKIIKTTTNGKVHDQKEKKTISNLEVLIFAKTILIFTKSEFKIASS